ncbi:hypothetical protein KY338_05480 [Candidatus Woesearchaeota archaeon]|nr:hypothetical protein [Candidatus Woesearchaeota archaeon]MBW3006354.1 hypothetical protein [Candidatus Woesearchaeota archaeon]
MGELSDIVLTAIPIIAGAHAAATLGKAYARHKATHLHYPNKSFLQRLPRCTYKRIIKPETLKYTAILSAVAIASYYILRNI